LSTTPRQQQWHVWLVLATVLSSACRGQPGPERESLRQRAVAALGARDGYVFVFSPFNCSLQASQIDAMNLVAARARRSGIILTVAPGEVADSVSATAVARLGLRMKVRSLARSPLRDVMTDEQLRLPLVIAIRGGQVIGMLAGDSVDRLDSWLAWLEQRPASPTI
jgi:hypothetical protein